MMSNKELNLLNQSDTILKQEMTCNNDVHQACFY